jgi:3-hydroxyisobutyrate dehydrogenase-like beta-hydroxyacid dehydrogenase
VLKLKVAIIGCGEVGRTYASAAHGAGMDVVLIDPRPARATVTLALDLGLTLHSSPTGCVADVDRVWLCVAGDLTVEVCDGLLGQLPATALVVDLTTAAAGDKLQCSRSFQQSGVGYVDGAIMGAVGATGSRTALLGAGDRAAEALADFAVFGAPVSWLDDSTPGDAATIKLLRTILTKGLESLAVECLMAAEQEGLRQQLYAVLGDVDDSGFVNFLNMLVRTHVQHANRRLHEVQRAQAQLSELGCPSVVLPGSEARFRVTSHAIATDPPEADIGFDVDAALVWLLANGRVPQDLAGESLS